MSIRFSLSTGEPLPFSEGLTADYNGTVLRGSIQSHIYSSLGDINLQQYVDEFVIVRKLTVNWTTPQRLLCQYDHLPGMACRMVLDNPLHEYIKGAGEVFLKKDCFSIFTGSHWTGLISALGSGEHNFIDIAWSEKMLGELLNTEDPLRQSLQEITSGLPEKFICPTSHLDTNMRHLLRNVFDFNYSDTDSRPGLHLMLMKFFKKMMKQATAYEPHKKNITKKVDWDLAHHAKNYIESNLEKQFTTPEISRMIGLNEYKLKNFLPIITGCSVDEFRRYLLFAKVGKKIIKYNDTPLKSFYAEAGYTNFSNFSKAFLKQCSCTPAELRQDKWDIDALPNYNGGANEG